MNLRDHVALSFDNRVNRAAVVASSEVATLPATNLSLYERSKIWRSNSVNSVTIDITLNADDNEAINCAALIDHNLTPGGTIRIQSWSDALDGTELNTDETIEPMQAVRLQNWLGFNKPLNKVLSRSKNVNWLPFENSVKDLYWRITLTDTSLAFLECAGVWIGNAFQTQVNANWRAKHGVQVKAPFNETNGGQRYLISETKRRKVSVSFSYLTLVEAADLEIQFEILPARQPVLFCFWPGDGIDTYISSIYGEINLKDTSAVRSFDYAATYEIEESL